MSLIETVRPRAEYLRLFREVVINVWKEKEIEAGLLARTAEKQLGDLKAKRTALVEAFVYRQAVTQAIYNEEIARIEEEITVAQIEASEARIDHLDIEAVLGFAEHVISNAGRLWVEFNLDQKQRLQRVLFPEGLRFADGEFGTAASSTIFTQLRPVDGEKSQLASPTGFECIFLGSVVPLHSAACR